MQFHTPKCDEFFFMRFQLFHQPDQHPVLAFANPVGEIFFWDLERIRVYGETMERLQDPNRDRDKSVRLPKWLSRPKTNGPGKSKATSNGRFAQATAQAAQNDDNRTVHGISDLDPKIVAEWDSMYAVRNRDYALEAHNKTEVNVKDNEGPKRSRQWAAPFVGRQATWSPGGEWCVVAGSLNVVFVLRRWGKPS